MKTTLICILSFISQALFAQSGSLDSTFGFQGKTILEVTSLAEGKNKVAVQSDNKILLTSSIRTGSITKFYLSRLNEDGTLDENFGTNGHVIIETGGIEDFVYDLAIQTDDKIIVAGTSGDFTNRDFALVRLMPNGTMDQNFGNSGIVKRNNEPDDIIHAIKIQSDGKVIAAGVSGGKVCLLRFNTNGTADNSFGNNGLVTTACGEYSAAYAVCMQEDGKILAAGQTMDMTADGVLMRYNPNGTLDADFGIAGKIIINSGGHDYVTSVQVQPDGKIIIGGAYGTASASGVVLDFRVLRFLNNGDYDPQFNGTGNLTIDFDGSLDVGNDIVIAHDNKILIAGYSSKNQQSDFALVRINVNGTLDTSFGNGGKVKSDFSSSMEIAQGIALYKNDRVLVSGQWGNNSFPMICCYFSDVATNLFISPKPSLMEAEISFMDDDMLILKVNNVPEQAINIMVFDVSGRMILQNLVNPDFNNKFSINISALLSNKIYLLQLSACNHVLNFKFYK